MSESSSEVSAEIQAMQAIEKAFTDLDAEVQARVLRWAADRYGVAVTGKRPVGSANASEVNAEVPEFDTLAEFFAAAAPTTEPDRALVVSHWFQNVKNEADVDAQKVNSELKHLGHGVSNITSALGSLIERRPQLVIQTKKSGTARQARKKYRVTAAGKSAVEHMLQRQPDENAA